MVEKGRKLQQMSKAAHHAAGKLERDNHRNVAQESGRGQQGQIPLGRGGR